MFGETTISYVKVWNHPIETTIYKWLALGFQGVTLLHLLFFLFLFPLPEPLICCQEQPPWLDHDVEIWERFRMFEEENLCRFSLRGLNNHFVQLMSKDGESLSWQWKSFLCQFFSDHWRVFDFFWLNNIFCFNCRCTRNANSVWNF